MAFTKPEFYVGIIITITLILTGVISCGSALQNNPNITLDDSSNEYIDMITGQEVISNFELSEETISSSQSEDLVFEDSSVGTPSTTDQLAQTEYFKNKADTRQNYFKLVFNIPSTIIVGLGLNLYGFTAYINIIVYAMSTMLGIMIWVKIIK